MKTALSIAALSVAALLAGCNNSSKTDAAAPGAVGNAKSCGTSCASACCQKTAAPGAVSTEKASSPACCPFSAASGCDKSN